MAAPRRIRTVGDLAVLPGIVNPPRQVAETKRKHDNVFVKHRHRYFICEDLDRIL
jgi:hypothetical protein